MYNILAQGSENMKETFIGNRELEIDLLKKEKILIEEKNKYLKKISLPMIIAVAAICDDSKKATYANTKGLMTKYFK